MSAPALTNTLVNHATRRRTSRCAAPRGAPGPSAEGALRPRPQGATPFHNQGAAGTGTPHAAADGALVPRCAMKARGRCSQCQACPCPATSGACPSETTRRRGGVVARNSKRHSYTGGCGPHSGSAEPQGTPTLCIERPRRRSHHSAPAVGMIARLFQEKTLGFGGTHGGPDTNDHHTNPAQKVMEALCPNCVCCFRN